MTRLQSFQRSYQVRTTAVSRVKDRGEMDVHNYLHPVIAAAGAYVLVANGINLFR